MPSSPPATAPAESPISKPAWWHTAMSGNRLLWLTTGLILVSGLVAVLVLLLERERTLEAGERVTHGIAAAVDEQASRTLQTVDQQLQLIALKLSAMQAAGEPDREEARAMLRQQITALPFVRSIWTLDAQGRVRYNWNDGPARLDLSDRDYFTVYRTRPGTGFFLGNPVLSRTSGTWLISGARPLTDRKGNFDGVVVVAIEPQYFDQLWRTMAFDAGGAVALLRSDGTPLLRSPMDNTIVDGDAGQALVTQHLPASASGGYRSEPAADGAARHFFAYRTLAERPDLVVIVGRSLQAILAPWRSLTWLVLILWAVVSLLATVLAIYFQRLLVQRTRAEQRSAQTAHRLTLAADAANLVVWDWDPREQHFWATPTQYTSLGYPPGSDQVDMAQWRSLVHEDDRARVYALIDSVRSDPHMPYDYEVRMRHADGSYRWCHISGHTIEYGPDGNPTRLIGVRIDVTERRKAEMDRQQIFNRITDGFIALDLDWRFIYANKQAGELLGHDPASLIGLDIWTTFPARPGETFHLVCRQAMLDQKPSRLEAFYPEFGRWIEDYIYPSPQGLSIYFRDVTQRKRDEEALLTAKEYAENLIEGANAMVVGLDSNGDVTMFNAAAERITGYTLADLKDRNWFEVLVPRQRFPQVWEVFEQLAEGTVKDQFENPILTRSGEERLIAWRNSVLYQGGVASGVLSFGVDVTEQRRNELALAKSSQRMRDLLDGLSETMFIGLTTPDGRLVEANRALREFGGRSWSELEGVAIDSFPVVSALESNRKTLRDALIRGAAGETSRFDIILSPPDGSSLTLDVSSAPLRDEQDRVLHIVFAGTDVTDRRKAEVALQESRELFHALADHSMQGIVLTQHGTVVYINPAQEHITGYSLEEAQQKTTQEVFEAVHPDDRPAALERHLRTERGEAVNEVVEIRVRHKDGDYRWLQVSAKSFVLGNAPARLGMLIDITDRKLAELAVRASEAKYRQLVDNAPYAIIVQVKRTIVMANRSAATVFGAPDAAALVGRSVDDISHPDYRESSAQRRRLLATGEDPGYPIELLARKLDGSTIDIQITATAIQYEGDEGIQVLVMDIGERKRAELELQQSEQRYRLLIDSSPYAIAVNQDGHLVMLNQAALELVGARDAQQLLGSSVFDRLHPDDLEAAQQRIARMMAGEKGLYPAQYTFLRLDGSPVEVQVTAAPFVYMGRPAIQIIALDVTRQKQAEQALLESESRFRSAFDSSGIGMALTELDGRWLLINPALSKIIGYSAEEMQQLTFMDLTHPEDLPADLTHMEHLLAGRTSSFQMEKRYIHKDGYPVWVNLTVALVRDANGRPLHTVAQMEDISQSKKLETALRASQADLATTLDALPDLLFEVDIDGRYLAYHSPRTDLLTAPVDELIGRLVSEVLPPAAAASILAGLQETLQTGRSGGRQIELELPTGHHWFELTIARKPEMPGERPRFVVLSRDVSERVLTQEALRASEERFREMAENVNEAFWLGDAKANRFLYISPAFESITGLSVATLMADPGSWHGLLHPLDRPAVEAVLQKRRPDEGYDLEFRIVRPDGQIRWVHGHAAPVLDAKGQQYRLAGVIDDITARKSLQLQNEVERAVLQSMTDGRALPEVLEQFVLGYASLLPGARGSVLLLDADGKHIRHGAAPHLPQAFCDAVDGQPIGPQAGSCGTAAFLGQPVLVADIDTDPLWQDYRELALSHGLHACWSMPIKSTQGAILGTFAFYFDDVREASAADQTLLERGAQLASTAIERHRAVEQLQQGEERYRSLVNWAPLGIGVHQEGVMVYANPTCLAIFGAASESELLGRRILDFIEPQDLDDVRGRIARVLSGEKMSMVLRKYYRLDGSVIDIEGKAAPITFNGAPAVQFSMRDVTAEKAAQSALLASREQLRVLSARVLATQETERRRVAHELHDELGQALTAIKINLQAQSHARGNTPKDLQAENIRIVEKTLDHVRGLALALRPSMLDDLGLVPALRWLTEQQAKRNALPVVFRAPARLQRLTPDRETAVFRIVQEALTNVLRHARASEVEVELRIEGDNLRVDIRDNGVGFDVASMQRRAIEGASIGVLGMVERASLVGATLEIHAEPGNGTTVSLVCPTGTSTVH